MSELLRRVADRMAEVQNHAQAGIVLIDGDHVALDLDALVDDVPDARLDSPASDNQIQNRPDWRYSRI